MGGLFLGVFENVAELGTITASPLLAGSSADFLLSGNMSEQALIDSEPFAEIGWSLPSVLPISVVCLTNVNLSSSATWRIRLSSTPIGGPTAAEVDTGMIPVYQAVSGIGGLDFLAQGNRETRRTASYIFVDNSLPAGHQFRHGQIDILDPNASDHIAIGGLRVGHAFPFDLQEDFEIGVTDHTTVKQKRSGGMFKDVRLPKYRARLPIRISSHAVAISEVLRHLFYSFGRAGEFFVSVLPESAQRLDFWAQLASGENTLKYRKAIGRGTDQDNPWQWMTTLDVEEVL